MDRFFVLNTHKLAFRLEQLPDKPQVLFLHGLGANHSQFQQEISNLAKDYSVAAISLRGQGNSTRPPGNKPEDMRISALAEDVIEWVRAHDWQRPHVIACSMGGVVALEILRQQKNMFKSLITFGTTPKLTMPKKVIKVGAWLSDMLIPGLFPNWMAKALPKTVTDKPEAQRRFTEDLKVAYSQRLTIYQLRCELANYDYLSVLQTTEIPVLLLQGEKDSAINREIAKLWPLIGENPLVRRAVIEDAGHIANYDQPQAFYNSIWRFLQEQSL